MDAEGLERFFETARERLRENEAVVRARLEAFTSSLGSRLVVQRRERQEQARFTAEEFNVFDFIRPNENRLSDVIAWLLDPHESHAQGETFLRLFLSAIDLPLDLPLTAARVYREDATSYILNSRRRLDVLIDFGTFGVGIENKPWALEGEEQVSEYLTHLGRKYGDRWALVYLSGDGSAPLSVPTVELVRLERENRFRVAAIPGEFRAWLRQCHSDCRAEKVRFLLADFLEYVDYNFRLAVSDGRNE